LKRVSSSPNKKWKALNEKYKLESFIAPCSFTENAGNLLLFIQGVNSAFIQQYLSQLLPSKEPRNLFRIFEDNEDIDFFHNVFNKNAKPDISALTREKNMKYYCYIKPINTAQDILSSCNDVETLLTQGFEIIGSNIFMPHKLNKAKTLLESGLTQSTKVSIYYKKRKEFLNFVDKTIEYLENKTSLVFILRLQNPLKTTEDLGKLSVLEMSNLCLSETTIMNFGNIESLTLTNKCPFEKLFLEYTLVTLRNIPF